MHIPDSMLQNSVCTVTLLASAASLVVAAHFARKSQSRPTPARFGAITALLFAAQMMNFPVMASVSGHLLGGVLAASLLGVPFGVLAVALVVAIQGLLFGDGGVAALGANIFNMAVLGAGAGGALYVYLRTRWSQAYALAGAAWAAVMLAALAASTEIALGGHVAFPDFAPSMLGIHAVIGLGEALLTVSVSALLAPDRRDSLAPFAAATLLAMASPYASAMPDGLEWAAIQQGILQVAVTQPSGAWESLVGVLVAYAGGYWILRSLERFFPARTVK